MKKILIIGVIASFVPMLASANFDRDLSYGMSGNDVTQLQGVLIESGCLNNQATGYFGSLTQQAVRCWQTQNNISGTGYVGSMTRTALNNVGSGTATQKSVSTPSTVLTTPTAYSSNSSACPSGYSCQPKTNYSADKIASTLAPRLAVMSCGYYNKYGSILFTKTSNGLLGQYTTGNYYINTVLGAVQDTSWAGYAILPGTCTVSFPSGASLYAGGLSTMTVGYFGGGAVVNLVSNAGIDFAQVMLGVGNNYLATYARTNNYCSSRPQNNEPIAVIGWPDNSTGKTLTGQVTGTSGYYDQTNITIPAGMQGSTAVSLANGCIIGQVNSSGQIADQYQLSYLFGN